MRQTTRLDNVDYDWVAFRVHQQLMTRNEIRSYRQALGIS